MSVGRLLEFSVIDEVRLVGSVERVDHATVVDTQDFVRPTMADGTVRLVAAAGRGRCAGALRAAQPDPVLRGPLTPKVLPRIPGSSRPGAAG